MRARVTESKCVKNVDESYPGFPVFPRHDCGEASTRQSRVGEGASNIERRWSEGGSESSDRRHAPSASATKNKAADHDVFPRSDKTSGGNVSKFRGSSTP